MKLISRTLAIPHQPGMAPTIDFVTYIHPQQPVLLRRHAWETADDIHEHHYDLISQDNGQTWTRQPLALPQKDESSPAQVSTESAAIYLPGRDRLVVIRNQHHQPPRQGKQGFAMGCFSQLVISVSTPEQRYEAIPWTCSFDLPMGLVVSFSHPLLSQSGEILLPIQALSLNTNNVLSDLGYPVQQNNRIAMDHRRVALLRGRLDDDDNLHWHLGDFVPADPSLSSRGLCEGTICELQDGVLAMVMRGSNHLWHDKPAYKWLSFSHDQGQSWSEAKPLGCDHGPPIESSSTGSLLFRSPRNHQLYWMGNLSLDGVRPKGNMPRCPLVIAKIKEQPFCLQRESITIIDQAAAHEHPNTQHSNFQLYFDRQTHEAIFYLTRYGERGYADQQWLNADHYCYRVQLD